MSDTRNPVGRLRVADGLLAALEHFGTQRYDWSRPHVFVYTTRRHVQQPWTVEDACRNAHVFLEQEDLAALRFEQLRRGLKEFGYERLYERIMGETIDAGEMR